MCQSLSPFPTLPLSSLPLFLSLYLPVSLSLSLTPSLTYFLPVSLSACLPVSLSSLFLPTQAHMNVCVCHAQRFRLLVLLAQRGARRYIASRVVYRRRRAVTIIHRSYQFMCRRVISRCARRLSIICRRRSCVAIQRKYRCVLLTRRRAHCWEKRKKESTRPCGE